MAGNQKLRAKLNDALKAYLESRKRFSEAEQKTPDDLQVIYLSYEKEAAFGKVKGFLNMIAKQIPEERRAEAHDRMEEVFKTAFANSKSFDAVKKTIQQNDVEYPTAKDKEQYLFRGVPLIVFAKGKGQDMIDVVMS